MLRPLLSVLAILLLSTASASARAAEGAIELNATCALLTGCAPGDAPNYPITPTASGSFVLTSNLAVTSSNDGVVLPANSTLDLNGFSIEGHVTCPLGQCPNATAGSGVVAGALTAVTNGRISGFGLDCVQTGVASRVEDLRVSECARHGINAGSGSFVAGNRVEAIGQSGLNFALALVGDTPSLYESNVIGSTGSASVVNGRASGPNSCPDQKCGTSGKRLYYLTIGTRSGATADTACASGFHFASLWEIHDTTLVEYDTTRGLVPTSTTQGPPLFTPGWIQGMGASCNAWTSTSSAVAGAEAEIIQSTFLGGLVDVIPWDVSNGRACNQLLPSWCVQN